MSWVPRWASNLGTQLRQKRVARELLAERCRRSVSRIDNGLRREAIDQRADRLDERVPVAVRQVDAADRALEEHVAGEERAVGVEGEVPGRVARDVQGLEVDAGELERLVAL